MALLDEFPHKCSIFRMAPQPDGLGGLLYSIVLEQSNVPCWEQQASASEIMEYEKRGVNIQTKVFFADDPKVTERHCLLITERFGEATPNLDVTDVANPDVFNVKSFAYPDASAGLAVLWRAMCASRTSSTE